MIPVGVAAGSGEDVPVGALAYVRVERVAIVAGTKGQRMILVQWLPIQYRFYGLARVILGDAGPTSRAFGKSVAGLVHVEIEPWVVVEPGGGSLAAARMEAHQHGVVVLLPGDAGGDAGGQRPPGLFESSGGAVAAENPNHALPAEPLAQELTVDAGV